MEKRSIILGKEKVEYTLIRKKVKRISIRVRGGGEVLVMDEIGPAERQAKAFCEAVLQALDGDIPILGVLQKGDYPLFAAIEAHPNVRLVEVTKENRHRLAAELRR